MPAVFVAEVSNLVDYATAWVPLICTSRFLYLWPKVRSLPWLLHYKSMEKNANASRLVCTHRNSPNLLESWWFGTAAMVKVRFLANNLLKGHQRSLEATHMYLPITLDWKEIERWGWLHCVCLIKTCRLICNMIYFGHYVTLTWGQILTLTFKVKSYIFRSISTREPRWCHQTLSKEEFKSYRLVSFVF